MPTVLQEVIAAYLFEDCFWEPPLLESLRGGGTAASCWSVHRVAAPDTKLQPFELTPRQMHDVARALSPSFPAAQVEEFLRSLQPSDSSPGSCIRVLDVASFDASHFTIPLCHPHLQCPILTIEDAKAQRTLYHGLVGGSRRDVPSPDSFRQLMSALKFSHALGVAHLDITPEHWVADLHASDRRQFRLLHSRFASVDADIFRREHPRMTEHLVNSLQVCGCAACREMLVSVRKSGRIVMGREEARHSSVCCDPSKAASDVKDTHTAVAPAQKTDSVTTSRLLSAANGSEGAQQMAPTAAYSTQLVGARGSLAAMQAPEVYCGKPFSPYSADLHSAGVLFYCLLSGGAWPYWLPCEDDPLFQHFIDSGSLGVPRTAQMEPGARSLLRNLITSGPDTRFDMEQLLAHPWLAVPPPDDERSRGQRSGVETKATAPSTHAHKLAGNPDGAHLAMTMQGHASAAQSNQHGHQNTSTTDQLALACDDEKPCSEDAAPTDDGSVFYDQALHDKP